MDKVVGARQTSYLTAAMSSDRRAGRDRGGRIGFVSA